MQLITDFNNFCINIFSGLDVNNNVNARFNLVFVGAFHPRSKKFRKFFYPLLKLIAFRVKCTKND